MSEPMNDRAKEQAEAVPGGEASLPEVQPGELVRAEFERLAHHPRRETRRLFAEADEGAVGATPFIELIRVVVVVLPSFLVILAIASTAYYVIR